MLRERTAHARRDQDRKRDQPQQTFQLKHRFHEYDQKRQHEELKTVVERVRVVGFMAVEQVTITYQERDHAHGRQHALGDRRTHVRDGLRPTVQFYLSVAITINLHVLNLLQTRTDRRIGQKKIKPYNK